MKYPIFVERKPCSFYLTRWIDDGAVKPPYKPDDIVYVIKYTALPMERGLPFKIQMKAKYTHKQITIAGYRLRLEDDDKYFKHMVETMEVPTDETYAEVEEQEGEAYWLRYETEPKTDKKETTKAKSNWFYEGAPIQYASTTTGRTYVSYDQARRYNVNEHAVVADTIDTVIAHDEFAAIPINNVNVYSTTTNGTVGRRLTQEELEETYRTLMRTWGRGPRP